MCKEIRIKNYRRTRFTKREHVRKHKRSLGCS